MFYIATLRPEYNMNLGGSGNLGYVVTDETKKILRNLGRQQWDSYTDEKKKQIVKNQLVGPRKGSHRSDETNKILSEKTKDFFKRNGGMSEEQKRKISEALKGKKRPNRGHFKQIVGTSKSGMKVYFESIKYAAVVLNINYSALCHCLRGDRKSANGFSWKYCSQETIQFWSREDVITSRSAMYPCCEDKDIVHTIAKNGSYGEYDKGLIALARRSNTIKTIAAECIYENDEFDCELASGRSIHHKMNIFAERGEVIGYYCLVELTNGGEQFAVMSKKDAEKFRDTYSKSYIMAKDKSTQNWGKNFDAMALKTCVIKALKLCPISIEALEAVSKEELKDIDDNSISVEYEEQIQKNSPKENKIASQKQKEQATTVEAVPQAAEKSENLAEQALIMTEAEEKEIDKAFEQATFSDGDIF